jgi:hypothetical protein
LKSTNTSATGSRLKFSGQGVLIGCVVLITDFPAHDRLQCPSETPVKGPQKKIAFPGASTIIHR